MHLIHACLVRYIMLKDKTKLTNDIARKDKVTSNPLNPVVKTIQIIRRQLFISLIECRDK